jgi:hypothetical protein
MAISQHTPTTSALDLFTANGLPAAPAARAALRYLRGSDGAATATGCIEWRGELRADGYPVLTVEVARKKHRFRPYRIAYELAKGPIPEGLTIDHLCRNRRCINADHLEPVTRTENTLRQASAIHGSDPGRVCKSGHVGEYKRDPRSQKLWCAGCHRERARRIYVPHPRREAIVRANLPAAVEAVA